jgi:serine/threonine protein kinase
LTLDLAGMASAPPPGQLGNPGTTETTGTRFGDYELREEIAKGGMGVVFKARQASLNRVVALKMILAGRFASRESVRRFRAEAEAAAQLRHPNILPIYEVGEEEGHQFFAMEFVEGRNLSELARHGPLPAERAARYVQLVAGAVQHAHEHGIIHRDLKPSNVLVDAFDQPRVTDFGLAKRYGVPPSGGSEDQGPAKAGTPNDLTLTGQVLGSPGFSAPEQTAGGNPATPASDLYSLGAILFHLLTGRPPFLSDTLEKTIAQVLTHWTCLAAPAESRRAAGSGDHLPQVSAEGASAAVRHRPGSGRGTGALSRGPAHSRTADWPRGKSRALVPAQAGAGGDDGAGGSRAGVGLLRRVVAVGPGGTSCGQ